MKNKVCPYCGKELSPEAVLCKYCHNLLIDEGEDMDDKTKVFSKKDIEDADKTKSFKMPASKNPKPKKKVEPVIEEEPEEVIEEAETDENDGADTYEGDFDNEVYENVDDADDEYDDDEYYYDEDEESKKRLFIIIAVITIAVLVVVIGAILIGMKLFGSGNKNNNSKPQNSSSQTAIVDNEGEGENRGEIDITTGGEDTGDNSQPIAVITPDSSDAEASSLTGESSEGSEDESSQGEGDESSQNDADTSSEGDSNSSEGENLASRPESSESDSSLTNWVVGGNSSLNGDSSGADASSQSDSSSQGETPVLSGNYESQAYAAASAYMSGSLVSSQYRTEDSEYAYYYFFTNDGADHGYSVAYSKSTGTAIVAQAY